MRLSAKSRKAANAKLSDLCLRQHKAIPLKEIGAILFQECGLVLEEGIYCGREGRSNETLRAAFTTDECDNSMLILLWQKFDKTGKFQITAYLS